MSILLFLLQTLVMVDESAVLKDKKIKHATDDIIIDNVLRVSESNKGVITKLSIQEVFINRKKELDYLCLKFKQNKPSLLSRHEKEKENDFDHVLKPHLSFSV